MLCPCPSSLLRFDSARLRGGMPLGRAAQQLERGSQRLNAHALALRRSWRSVGWSVKRRVYDKKHSGSGALLFVPFSSEALRSKGCVPLKGVSGCFWDAFGWFLAPWSHLCSNDNHVWFKRHFTDVEISSPWTSHSSFSMELYITDSTDSLQVKLSRRTSSKDAWLQPSLRSSRPLGRWSAWLRPQRLRPGPRTEPSRERTERTRTERIGRCVLALWSGVPGLR